MPASERPPALAFEEVSFGYTQEPIFTHVSAAVAPGEMVGLLGPNGAGKSTLLGLASGMLAPRAGSVRLHGANLRRIARRELARQVAVVPQDFSVQFAYTVRQLVELGRAPYLGVWGTLETGDRHVVEEALAETNTAALADRVFNELSGGERQRVIVALALAQAPSVLLLDEPTAHLDIKHQIEILELLCRLNFERGLTVLAALHDLNLAARFFQRLILFQRAIVADGPPGRVLEAGLLTRVYGTAVHVGILRGDEHLSVFPPGYPALGALPDPAAIARPRVHVLAGGGSGELLMRTLADAGIPFGVGPLNAGDSDAALARRLAAQTLEEPPYAPVSSQGLAAARKRMLDAGVVVICPMPLGPGNVELLATALEALVAGARALLLEPSIAAATATNSASASHLPDPADLESSVEAAVAARDFSGRGVEFYRALLAAGAGWASSPGEVVALLDDGRPENITPM
jgi:iron complex transport system ATP-binding protein